MTYDEYVDYKINEYYSMPFPYSEYTNYELMKSFNDLKRMNCNDKYHHSLNINTRLGDRLIHHFHQSIYRDKHMYELWYNEDVLREMIIKGYLYHSYINKNKILQGFNVHKSTCMNLN